MVEPGSMPVRVSVAVSSAQMETSGVIAAFTRETPITNWSTAVQEPGVEACT